jgi:three-Cys-motif partner protein
MVFADIEGPTNLAFATIQELKRKHTSVDLYVLYPSDIGLLRLADYKTGGERFTQALVPYFGTEECLEIIGARRTDSQSHAMRKALLDLYVAQLRTLWSKVEVLFPVRKRDRLLYYMLFAYDHPAAGSIAVSAAKDEKLDLFDGILDP